MEKEFSSAELKRLANKLAEVVKPGSVIALYGDLGSGKTTFTSYLSKALGFESRVQSPTFVIVRIYTRTKKEGQINSIYHVDLYRLTSSQEVADLGLMEMFEDDSGITVIEWPEIIESILPEGVIRIRFEVINESTRKVTLENIKLS